MPRWKKKKKLSGDAIKALKAELLQKNEKAAQPLDVVRITVSAPANIVLGELFKERFFYKKIEKENNLNLTQSLVTFFVKLFHYHEVAEEGTPNLVEYVNERGILFDSQGEALGDINNDCPDIMVHLYMNYIPLGSIKKKARLRAVLSFSSPSSFADAHIEDDEPRSRFDSIEIADFMQIGLTSEVIENAATFIKEKLRGHLSRRGVVE